MEYLWASNVTASAYFLHSGVLLYENNALSAYATAQELEIVRKYTNKLANNPEEILKYELEFKNIREKIKKIKPSFNKTSLRKISNRELYNLFLLLIDTLKNYICAYRWTEPHFVESIEQSALKHINNCLPENINARDIIADLLSAGNKKMYASYSLDDLSIKMVNLLNEIARMRFRAKKINMPLALLSVKIMKETAKRTYLAVSQISQLELEELEGILILNKPLNMELLNKRRRKYALKINMSNPVRARKLSDNETKKIIEFDHRQADATSFNGSVVYPGKVTGFAKIVPALFTAKEHKDYIDTLKKTDIIVAPMTAPDLTPAFSRVAAVITDEGGIMSHAALVAREKRIPCIIGTRVATRALHNGDKITVDANSGTITKHK